MIGQNAGRVPVEVPDTLVEACATAEVTSPPPPPPPAHTTRYKHSLTRSCTTSARATLHSALHTIRLLSTTLHHDRLAYVHCHAATRFLTSMSEGLMHETVSAGDSSLRPTTSSSSSRPSILILVPAGRSMRLRSLNGRCTRERSISPCSAYQSSTPASAISRHGAKQRVTVLRTTACSMWDDHAGEQAHTTPGGEEARQSTQAEDRGTRARYWERTHTAYTSNRTLTHPIPKQL